LNGQSLRPKNLKECIKFNWNFQTGGGGGLLKDPFRGGGMGNLRNCTIDIKPHVKVLVELSICPCLVNLL